MNSEDFNKKYINSEEKNILLNANIVEDEEDSIYDDDYRILKCETGEILDTENDYKFFNKLEVEKQKIYEVY